LNQNYTSPLAKGVCRSTTGRCTPCKGALSVDNGLYTGCKGVLSIDRGALQSL